MADVKKVKAAVSLPTRESELAMARIRSSSALGGIHPYLRKMAALIHREDAVGIIAQRILGNDATTNEIVNRVVAAMWLDTVEAQNASITGGIDLFGWPIVREIAVVALLHQVHAETAAAAGINPMDLDRSALAVLTSATEMGSDSFSALLANIGMAGLAVIGRGRYARLRQQIAGRAEDLSSAEREEFGFDHAVLGAAMLWEADFPDHVCKVVQNHSSTTSPIWLGEQIAYQMNLGAGLRTDLDCLPIELCLKFGMTSKRLDHLRESIISAAALPGMHFNTAVSYRVVQEAQA